MERESLVPPQRCKEKQRQNENLQQHCSPFVKKSDHEAPIAIPRAIVESFMSPACHHFKVNDLRMFIIVILETSNNCEHELPSVDPLPGSNELYQDHRACPHVPISCGHMKRYFLLMVNCLSESQADNRRRGRY